MKHYLQYYFRYRKLIREIGTMRIYDGRNQGVDIYECDECGGKTATYYQDKGVTPFTIICPHCGVGTMRHTHTVTPRQAQREGCYRIFAWYRPSYREMVKLGESTIEYILKGGLLSTASEKEELKKEK